ncbi:MAG: hypothetical protein NVSMB26_08940 [Beijerinckiaceae bacterium]
MNKSRFIFLGVAASAALAGGVALLVLASGSGSHDEPPKANIGEQPPASAQTNPPTGPHAAARQTIEARLNAVPEYQRFFDRLRLTFPSEYEATLDTFADRLVATGKEQSVDLYLSEAVRDLRQSRGALAAKSDAGPLGQIFDVQLAMLNALAGVDPRLCVDFLYGGASESFHKFSSQNRGLASDMAVAGLEAIANGQAKKNDRQPPSDADFQMLEMAMASKGLDKVEIGALLDGKVPDPPLDDARMCRAGRIYLEMLKMLPEPVRLRIYALAVELMARS